MFIMLTTMRPVFREDRAGDAANEDIIGWAAEEHVWINVDHIVMIHPMPDDDQRGAALLLPDRDGPAHLMVRETPDEILQQIPL